MADGDPLADEDVWIRNLTNADWILKEGKIHRSAMTGRTAIAIPPAGKNRQWGHEMSGRCKALCDDVVAEGEAFVAKVRQSLVDSGRPASTKFTFAGVAISDCKALRAEVVPGKTSSVIHTPQLPDHEYPDPAHSDFVTYNTVDDDVDEIRAFLQKHLRAVRAPDIATALANPPAGAGAGATAVAVSSSAAVSKVSTNEIGTSSSGAAIGLDISESGTASDKPEAERQG